MLAQNQSRNALCRTVVRVLAELYCLLMKKEDKVVSYCWKICVYNLSDRFTTPEMKGKVLTWASLQCSRFLWVMHKGEQGWSGCDKAARRRQEGPDVLVPSREGWAMPLWALLSPAIDKTSITAPAILLNPEKIFITSSGQEITLFFAKLHIIIHTHAPRTMMTGVSGLRTICAWALLAWICLLGESGRMPWHWGAANSSLLVVLPSLAEKSMWWYLFAKLMSLNIFCFSEIPILCLWRQGTYFCFGENSLGHHILWKLFEVALV